MINSTRHQGRTMHFCSFCPYSSYLLGNLKKHVHIHTGERPFKCPMCNYRSSQKENLKKHLVLHSRPVDTMGNYL